MPDYPWIARGKRIRTVGKNKGIADHTTMQAAVDWIIANGSPAKDNAWQILVLDGLYQNANAKVDCAGLTYTDIVGQSWNAILLVDNVAQAGGVVILGGSSSSDATNHLSLRNITVVNKLDGSTTEGNAPEGAVYVGAEDTHPSTLHWDNIVVAGCRIVGSHDGLQVFGVGNDYGSAAPRLVSAWNDIRSAHDTVTVKGDCLMESVANYILSDNRSVPPWLSSSDIFTWKNTGFHHNCGEGDNAADQSRASGSLLKSTGDRIHVISTSTKEGSSVGVANQHYVAGILVYTVGFGEAATAMPMEFTGTNIKVESNNDSDQNVGGLIFRAQGTQVLSNNGIHLDSFTMTVDQTNTSGPATVAGIWSESNNTSGTNIHATNGRIDVTNAESGTGNAYSAYAVVGGSPAEDTITASGVYSGQSSGGSGTIAALSAVT